MGVSQGRPLVSVVVEGYNQAQEQGIVDNTLHALRHQDFPLDQVEVILVGSAYQLLEWQSLCYNPAPFQAIKLVDGGDAIYYELKNKGAAIATGDIIAFTDSDVCPQRRWLSSIVTTIRQGADASVGFSLFKRAKGWAAGSIVRQIAACITFAYVLGKIRHWRSGQLPDVEVRSIVGHNVALRRELFQRCQYRIDQGRLLASPLLFSSVAQVGAIVALHPQQQVVHYFTWTYWVRLHFRFGYEIYQLRRLDPVYPNQWIARMGILEPLVTLGWHMVLDIPRWLRFSCLLSMNPLQRWGLLPVVMGLSLVAHSAEMVGMYWTMVAPAAMKQWAEYA
ncbi:MAG: glycosyltransferase [Cyanobacteria bacterium]|nr:glycosyltransferase [Cyanobacteriota bacterium]